MPFTRKSDPENSESRITGAKIVISGAEWSNTYSTFTVSTGISSLGLGETNLMAVQLISRHSKLYLRYFHFLASLSILYKTV
jgi:hypothetical protein